MIVNGTQNRKLAGWTPGGVHLLPGGRALRECRPGAGREGHVRLLAHHYPFRLHEPCAICGIMGDACPMGTIAEKSEKKGCKLAEASIHDHVRGRSQPDGPFIT